MKFTIIPSWIMIASALLMSKVVNAAEYEILPEKLDGSMSLYDFSSVQPSEIPDSLTPFSISYIARHGARYLTSEKKVADVEKALLAASEKGSITVKGKECLKLMKEIREHTGTNWGQLSEIGRQEEFRLGADMVAMFPDVFAVDARLTGVSSYVPRVIETMDQFFISIADRKSGISTSAASGKQYDMLTRFFVAVADYDHWREHGDWKEVYDDFVKRHLPVEPALRLVGNKSGLSEKALRNLTYDLYKVLQGLRAMGLNPPTTQWMTREEYRLCWEATNMQKYFQYSISPLSTAPAEGAAGVLFHLVGCQQRIATDPAATRGIDAIFGHAETLLPVFALLGVPSTTALPLDYDKLASEWSDAELTPLAANLAIIYSRGKSGKIYASMRLNGRNVSPVNDSDRLTVPMEELQQYWLDRYFALLHKG